MKLRGRARKSLATFLAFSLLCYGCPSPLLLCGHVASVSSCGQPVSSVPAHCRSPPWPHSEKKAPAKTVNWIPVISPFLHLLLLLWPHSIWAVALRTKSALTGSKNVGKDPQNLAYEISLESPSLSFVLFCVWYVFFFFHVISLTTLSFIWVTGMALVLLMASR